MMSSVNDKPTADFDDLIRIIALDKSDLRPDAVSIGAGVRKVTDAEISNQFYIPQAIVPEAAWRELTREEWSSFTAVDRIYDPRCTVGLARLDDDIWGSVLRVVERFKYARSLSEEFGSVGAVIRELENYLIARFDGKGEYVSQGLKSTAPGLLTTAIDREIGGLAGLHVDAWDGVLLEERIRSRTRVTVNIGPDTRHLLFVPIRLDSMKRMIDGVSKMSCGISEAWYRFAEEFPNLPVIRISLRPGDVYMAATDFIVHDGSTQGAISRTFTVQIRCHFL